MITFKQQISVSSEHTAENPLKIPLTPGNYRFSNLTAEHALKVSFTGNKSVISLLKNRPLTGSLKDVSGECDMFVYHDGFKAFATTNDTKDLPVLVFLLIENTDNEF